MIVSLSLPFPMKVRRLVVAAASIWSLPASV
jgi:hypothetical protein